MNECIFCRIITGEIPATKIYEDEDTLVFMDIGPIIKGHALVIPKLHYEMVVDTPDELLGKIHVTAKKIAAAQMNGLGADGVNIIQNNGKASGQEVFHIHTHVIPRFSDDGHKWNWKAGSYRDNEELNRLAEKMQKHL